MSVWSSHRLAFGRQSSQKFATFHEYYNLLSTLLYNENWSSAEKVAQLLSCRDEHASYRFLQIEDVDGEFPDRQAMEWAFDDIVVLHLRVLYLMNAHQYETAYTTQATIIQVFNKEILQKEKEANWFMPVLYKLCSDLRLLARAADARPSRTSHRRAEQASFYEDAANPIMESYRICVAESRVATETTKKVAILNLTNHLFRIYFRINRLNLLKPLIRAIDHAGDELFQTFSMADKVTYNYYLGRKAMFDSDLQRAEECLSHAFRNCPNQYKRNKRLILAYLIPVKMFLGHMPTQELLQKYELLEFSQVVASVKEGNLRKLSDALEEHQHFFIECGIFLMLEKLKIITYRTLFKQVVSILNTHQIKLDAFLVALSFLGTEMDADELSCILANLIAQKKIKGYISHQHQTLVVSKADPFPPLSGVIGR